MIRRDIFAPEKRAQVMASIRSKNTSIERTMAAMLRVNGIPHRRHFPAPGTPDFAFPERRLAVFCHGAFWHGTNYRETRPKLNDYWRKKIEANVRRDARVKTKLRREGWRVLVLHEKDIRRRPQWCVERIKKRLAVPILDFSADAWNWYCLNVHGGNSASSIARRYGVSRQRVCYALKVMRARLSNCPGGMRCRCGKRVATKRNRPGREKEGFSRVTR